MIKKLPARLLPRTLALGFAATVIAAVLGITGVRMLPSLGDYRQEIEAWVAKSGGYPVMISSIEASWYGIAPSIEVTDMWVLDHNRTRSLLRFARGSLRIDLVASLKQRRVIPDRLSLSGMSLTLVRTPEEAQLFNRSVRIDIESTKDDAWVILKGKADRAFLAERLAARGVSRLFERVKGETDWQAKLDLTRPWNDPAGGENLEIRSSLIGLQIDAPAPLGKTYLGKPRPFILKTSLAHAPARWITLEYGEIFKAKLMLAGQSSSSLRQASIQLGRRTMRPTNSARLWIGGRLEEFSLSQWTDFLDTMGPLLSSNPPAPHKLSPIGMDIVVSRLEGFGNWFNNIRLIADNALDTWRFKIDGKDAAGMIHVPSAKYVKAKLTRLILAHPATDTPTIAIEPARFPAVSVNCDRFVLKSFDLGKMALSMRPHPSGLRLESLTLTSPTIHIKAQGDWQSASGIPMSRFDISAQGPDLRGLLRRFNL